MKQKTICYANTIDWDFKGLTQRPHHIMRLLSEKGYKVYYVNATKRIDRVRDRISENLEIYYNWDVFLKRVPKVDIYFSSWANRYVDLDRIEAEMVLYDSLDNFPEHEPNELKMISIADAVLAASQPLYDLRRQQHNNVFLCKNACFLEHGEKDYEVPDDLKKYKISNKPIILFSGALASNWCDLELVEKIAAKHQLVVVGRGWNIEKMPKGVIYLGAKTHDELQAYYRHCDVNILPFKRGQISDFSSPIKLWESMIHGTPSVATNIPEATIYPEVILSSQNHDEFMKNIEKALQLSKSPEYRTKAKKLASQNTWNHRVDLIDNIIKDFFENRGK